MSRSLSSPVDIALSRNKMGVRALSQIGVSSAAPEMVIGGLFIAALSVTGQNNIGIGMLILTAIISIWAVGFTTLAERIPNAGALYTHVTHGLGRPLGLATAFIALLAYEMMQIGLYGIFGPTVADLVQTHFGVTVEWWIFAGIACLIVAFLGTRAIDLNSKILGILLAGEVLFVLVFIVVAFMHPAEGTTAINTVAATFNPAVIFSGGFAVLVTLVISYVALVGVEAPASYAEEAIEGGKTVKRSIRSVVIALGGLYVLATVALAVTVGPENLVQAAQEQGPALIFNIVGEYLGSGFQIAGMILFASSILAGLMAFHQSVNRYTFAFAREAGMTRLARTNSAGAAYNASLLQSATGAAAIIVVACLYLDPLVALFYTLGSSGGFGVLIATTLTSFAVVGYFHRRKGTDKLTLAQVHTRRHGQMPPAGWTDWCKFCEDEAGIVSRWRRIVAPIIAGVLMTGIILATAVYFDVLLGVPAGHPLRWIMPLSFPFVGMIGLGLGFWLKRHRRNVYTNIGSGTSIDYQPVSTNLNRETAGAR